MIECLTCGVVGHSITIKNADGMSVCKYCGSGKLADDENVGFNGD